MNVLRGYAGVGLYNPRDSKNVAHALRACGCFDAAFLAYTGARYKHDPVDTQKAWRHMPLLHVENILFAEPTDCKVVAIEITDDATPLETFVHPERAYYIFGPEDGSIPEHELRFCHHVVRINSRFCLNLAMCVNVVLYDRMAKGTPNRTPFRGGEPHA